MIDACFNLAMIYFKGSTPPLGFEGCEADMEKAKNAFIECAKLGDEEAKKILADNFDYLL